MAVVHPSSRWSVLPEDWAGTLAVTRVDGVPTLMLDDRALPTGTELQLHRAGSWHDAWVGLDDDLHIVIQVHPGEWPGSPCRVSPDDLSLVAARLRQ